MHDVAALRLTAQMLAGPPATDVVSVARRLLAVQAQDARGFRLAVRARTSGLAGSDVDCALTDERSVVVGWLNRGTLHLVASEDYAWLHSLTAPRLLRGNARRLHQEGVGANAADRGVAIIERALGDDGPLTRAELGDRLAHVGIPTKGQALVHILMLACLRGVALRGPVRGRQHAYVLAREWVPWPSSLDRDAALAELGRRYLAGHGPATDRDLAKWAGLPLGEARRGLDAIASELVERGGGMVDLARRGQVAEPAPPRLLGAFEPLLMGWVSRENVLGANERRVVANGMFRPIALVGGRAAATWRIHGGYVAIEPLERISATDNSALQTDGERVIRFLVGATG